MSSNVPRPTRSLCAQHREAFHHSHAAEYPCTDRTASWTTAAAPILLASVWMRLYDDGLRWTALVLVIVSRWTVGVGVLHCIACLRGVRVRVRWRENRMARSRPYGQSLGVAIAYLTRTSSFHHRSPPWGGPPCIPP